MLCFHIRAVRASRRTEFYVFASQMRYSVLKNCGIGRQRKFGTAFPTTNSVSWTILPFLALCTTLSFCLNTVLRTPAFQFWHSSSWDGIVLDEASHRLERNIVRNFFHIEAFPVSGPKKSIGVTTIFCLSEVFLSDKLLFLQLSMLNWKTFPLIEKWHRPS